MYDVIFSIRQLYSYLILHALESAVQSEVEVAFGSVCCCVSDFILFYGFILA